jgi:hypothetical protein
MKPSEDRMNRFDARDLSRIEHGVDDSRMGAPRYDYQPLVFQVDDQRLIVADRVRNHFAFLNHPGNGETLFKNRCALYLAGYHNRVPCERNRPPGLQDLDIPFRQVFSDKGIGESVHPSVGEFQETLCSEGLRVHYKGYGRGKFVENGIETARMVHVGVTQDDRFNAFDIGSQELHIVKDAFFRMPGVEKDGVMLPASRRFDQHGQPVFCDNRIRRNLFSLSKDRAGDHVRAGEKHIDIVVHENGDLDPIHRLDRYGK